MFYVVFGYVLDFVSHLLPYLSHFILKVLVLRWGKLLTFMTGYLWLYVKYLRNVFFLNVFYLSLLTLKNLWVRSTKPSFSLSVLFFPTSLFISVYKSSKVLAFFSVLIRFHTSRLPLCFYCFFFRLKLMQRMVFQTQLQ